MPTFNAGRFLSSSIDSILAQTYTNLELIISDDGSTDPQTISTLKHYAAKDPRVKVKFLEKNHGPGFARNEAIERAQGRYIAFCDSDDRWFPDKLEKQLALTYELLIVPLFLPTRPPTAASLLVETPLISMTLVSVLLI